MIHLKVKKRKNFKSDASGWLLVVNSVVTIKICLIVLPSNENSVGFSDFNLLSY